MCVYVWQKEINSNRENGEKDKNNVINQGTRSEHLESLCNIIHNKTVLTESISYIDSGEKILYAINSEVKRTNLNFNRLDLCNLLIEKQITSQCIMGITKLLRATDVICL